MAFDDTPVYAGAIAALDEGSKNLMNSFYVQRLAFASRPAAGNAGVVFLSSDGAAGGGGDEALYRDNGSTWDLIGLIALGADYLVGTAQPGLTAEIVVGAAPGGELGGSWASPTVDGTHSGSAHHSEPPAPVFGRVVRTAGDITTTSTSLVDVTGATITFTTGAFPVQYAVAQTVFHATATSWFNVIIDSTLLHGTSGLQDQNISTLHSESFSGQTAALTAASHTIKEQWRVSSGTGIMKAGTGGSHMFSAHEIR